MDVPLEILDREVARAAAALGSARSALARGEADVTLDMARRPSSRGTFVDLAEAQGPLAAPLRAWVYALTLERVLWADTTRLAAAWHASSIDVSEPGVPAFTSSPRDLLMRVLREDHPARRRVFADALVRGATPSHDAACILADRRAEAARQLGVSPDAFEIPVDPPAHLAAVAERLLADTAGLLDRHDTWHAALAASTGRAFAEGWPARLGPRWLFDLFHRGPLTEGLRLAITTLPEAIGASSFARALGLFGDALAGEGAPRGFFALTRAPFNLRRSRRAALFAGLAADPVFAARALGLGRGRARDQARGVARALLISLRLDAARVILRGALSLPRREREARFEEVTAAALGAPIPPSLAGVVPRLGADDPTRLAGAILAASDRRALVEGFDEDWFKSPHAAHAIREEDAAPPASFVASKDALDAGLATLAAWLSEHAC